MKPLDIYAKAATQASKAAGSVPHHAHKRVYIAVYIATLKAERAKAELHSINAEVLPVIKNLKQQAQLNPGPAYRFIRIYMHDVIKQRAHLFAVLSTTEA
jgi:adenylosuccinate lyase